MLSSKTSISNIKMYVCVDRFALVSAPKSCRGLYWNRGNYSILAWKAVVK